MFVAGQAPALEGRAVEIVVVSGNRGDVFKSNRLREGGAKIRIGGAAVANVPTGIDSEIHEVGEAFDTRRSCRGASIQGAELIEIDRPGSPVLEIGVEEGCVTYFIQRVAADVLRAVGIQIREGKLVVIQGRVRIGIYLNGLIVADTTQFRILRPQVRFDQLGGCQKLENGDVSRAEGSDGRREQPASTEGAGAHHGCSCGQ